MKFLVSICDICGKVDGSIQNNDHLITVTDGYGKPRKVKSYDMTRDKKEWEKEGRVTREVELKEGERHVWCEGHDEMEGV